MLSKLHLSRFKSISTDEDITFSNVSIICGPNSSGKSSLIQAILMLSQTFGSRYDQDTMVLNGHLVRLGAFSDIRTHKADMDNIEVGFTLRDPVIPYGLPGVKEINCKFVFGGTKKSRIFYSESDFHPPILRIEITLKRTLDGAEKTERLILNTLHSDIVSDVPLTPTQKGVFAVETCSVSDIEDIAKDYPGYKILGCERNEIIPHVLHLQYDHAKKMSAKVVGLISGNISLRPNLVDDEIDSDEIEIPPHFLQVLRNCIEVEYQELTSAFEAELNKQLTSDIANRIGTDALEKMKRELTKARLTVVPEIVDPLLKEERPLTLRDWNNFIGNQRQKERKALQELVDKYRSKLQSAWYQGSKEDLRTVPVPLRSIFFLSSHLISYFTRSIKYLGPLRSEPQAVYTSLGHTDPNHVGLKGEYTAAALHINRKRVISYPSPSSITNEQFSFRIREASLQEACREWLEYLGVVVDYRTRDRGKLGYEIYVKTHADERWQDLTHVGVGVSQVLPIVLMFLLSQPEDLLVFEQPELHLHPKIQSRLCDFFTAMSAVKRQSIVETHSEYMINRLRLRIAQSREDRIRSSSSVYFVTKVDGSSKFSNVEITKYGAIPEWPEDFFDQTDVEIQKLLIEASNKRREERKESRNASRN